MVLAFSKEKILYGVWAMLWLLSWVQFLDPGDALHPFYRHLIYLIKTKQGHNYTILTFSVPEPWHFGTNPDPALFVSDLQDANKKYFFSLSFYALSFWFFKYKKSQRSHKTVEIKEWQNPQPDLYKYIADPDAGGPETYRSGTLLTSYCYCSTHDLSSQCQVQTREYIVQYVQG